MEKSTLCDSDSDDDLPLSELVTRIISRVCNTDSSNSGSIQTEAENAIPPADKICQLENSDSDGNVPFIELSLTSNDINNSTIEEAVNEITIENAEEDRIHVYITNDDDEISDYIFTDENGNLISNNCYSTLQELENDVYNIVEEIEFDPFDINLDDSVGSEIEIGLESNDYTVPLVQCNEADNECIAEKERSESEYNPDTDVSDSSTSESENRTSRKKVQRKTDKLKSGNIDKSFVHSYAKPLETETRTSRKRKREPQKWLREIRKRRRQHGKEYESAKGARVPMKSSKPVSCRCKYKCRTKFDKVKKEPIFHQYWEMSYDLQRSFIAHHVKCIDKKRRTQSKEESRRQYTYEYFLPLDGALVQTCKSSFINILDIGPKVINYTMQRDKRYDTKDKRGHHTKIEISNKAKDELRKHIHKFPVIESHYCRKDTKKQYLEKGLSVRKMYRMYVEDCKDAETRPQKFWLYNSIFNNDFNLGFHLPKKDLCSFCEIYKTQSDFENKEREKEYRDHEGRKERVRKMKQEDKERAMNDTNMRVINFDLQKVLISPKTDIGEVYYSRKLATYNFTVFDIVSKVASCYMWHEGIAKRGSNDIASCIHDYNRQLGNVDELVYYSDSCSGQQRNLPFATMCLYSVQHLPIKTITHNFFERGHSQMEGDSVHATIEKATKKHDMFSPMDWMSAVSNSKISAPRYKVIEIATANIKDFKELADQTVSNRSKAIDGTTLQWTKVHSFQFRKSEPNRIYFKYDFNMEYNYIEIARANMRKKQTKSMSDCRLKEAYKGEQSISRLKYDDLIKLCKKNVIPTRYHSFYESLTYDD